MEAVAAPRTNPAAPYGGLDEADAARRLAARPTEDRDRTSRSAASIVRANVLTRFNAILGGLLVVILVVGPLQDALFGVVLVANAAIGIVQEWRAKRSLDRLALVAAPSTRVIRSGRSHQAAIGDVLVDDLVDLATVRARGRTDQAAARPAEG